MGENRILNNMHNISILCAYIQLDLNYGNKDINSFFLCLYNTILHFLVSMINSKYVS